MSFAAAAGMRHRALTLGLLLASAVPAVALTLDNIRVQATLVDGSAKDPFRIRARLSGADPRAIATSFATIRFGDLRGEAPVGGFVRHGNVFTWRSYLFGVKKVSINVKKGTLDIVGGGVDLGDLPGPVRLAFGTAKGVACGTFEWTGAQVTQTAASRRHAVRKTATGPLESCFGEDDGLDHKAPSVFITSPTPLPGIATTAASIDVGGSLGDDTGVVGVEWSTNQGGGGSLVPGDTFDIAGIGLMPGDTRITVTAMDAAGNTGSDVLDVTYNTNGIVFEGMPTAAPEALLMEDADSLTLRQKILANPDIDPATIRVEHMAADDSMTEVGGLADAGDRKFGDDLPGDDVYSGLVGVDGGPAAIVAERFRIVARTLSQPDVVAMSPILVVPRVDLVEPEATKAAITLADNARTMFTGLLADGVNPDDALEQVVELATASGAIAAGASEGKLGAWWVTEDGLLGGMLGYDQTTKRGGAAGSTRPPLAATHAKPHPVANATTGALPVWSEVGSRKTLILAPYFADAEPAGVDGMLTGMQCPQFEVETLAGAAADAERFKGLENYGMVLIASHGDTLFGGLGDAYHPEWDWPTTDAQAVVLTGTKLGSINLRRWERDLRMGRMAIFPEGALGVLPSYFTQYSVRLPQSVVYVGTCRSTANESLSSALLERGAGAVFGFDGYVDSGFAGDVGFELFSSLLAGQTIADAFLPNQQDGGTPAAFFTVDGETSLSLATGPIVNRSFEVQSGFLASVAGFTVDGDGRIIGNLGLTYPTDGARMALVSTGLGLTKKSGSFSQPVCLPPLPPGATTITLEYDWNFFSEEFLEYCDSQFQDFFRVSFGDAELQNVKIMDLCNDPGVTLTPADVEFDQGGVYMTGWTHQTVDLTSLAGTTATLTFAAGDVGDSIFDTVILVDNVRLKVE
jgi:hypothetical protein